MSIFDKKKEISRRAFRKNLKRASPYIPGTTKRYSQKERTKMERELFGPEYGGHISKGEFKDRIQGLSEARHRVKTSSERLKIERKIRYLKKLGGV